jgi:4-hydroxythreonine-4-phosphate dehydrogenase
MKLLGGLAAVNVTIGLPFLRTSVSHGVAQDVVGQGVACHSSLLAALTQLHQWVSPAAKG